MADFAELGTTGAAAEAVSAAESEGVASAVGCPTLFSVTQTPTLYTAMNFVLLGLQGHSGVGQLPTAYRNEVGVGGGTASVGAGRRRHEQQQREHDADVYLRLGSR